MDSKPFFSFQLDALRSSDVRTLASFVRATFNIEKIVAEAANLKLQSLVTKELEREFASPSEDFIRVITNRVHEGRITSTIKESYKALITAAIGTMIREKVNERLTSALLGSKSEDEAEGSSVSEEAEVVTTQDEIDGLNIVRAIASRSVDPSRIVMRDAKSYCAILLDDNNRKPVARLHFNSPNVKYLGTFAGKEEVRQLIASPIEIYKHEQQIASRLAELVGSDPSP